MDIILLVSYSYSLILVPLILIMITLYFTFFSSSKDKSQSSSIDTSQYPPGNIGWPVVGESLELLNAGRKGVPEKFIGVRMQKFSPEIFKTSLLGETAAVFCGPAGNKFLFSNENKLVKTWWPKSIDKIFPSSTKNSSSTQDEEGKKMRKILPKFFKPEALQRYIPIMDTAALKHLEANWDNKKEVLVFPQSKNYTFVLACRLLASINDPSLIAKLSEPFAALAAGIISIPINLPGTPFNRGIKASNYVRNELLKVIKQRKIEQAENEASPTLDILSHMLLTADEDGQSESDIVNKILALLIGGHDTTSSAITFIVKYLAELPEVYNEVRKEQMEIAKAKGPGELLNWDDIQKMKYSWNVAREVMRLAPPLQGAFREAIADFSYGGFSIPKGWKLYWSANSTHRNPDYFKEPEKFDPSRFEGTGPTPYTFVPFGGGPRMCPGKEYARLEILAFMYHVVRRYKWEKILPDEKIVVDPMPMPAKGLPVRLYPQTTLC